CSVLLKPLAYDFRLSNVRSWSICFGVVANKNVYSSLVEFLAGEEVIKFGAGSRDSLPGPI
ncbi:MAG TPA: hypothetical protein PLB62_04130, partial [Candidatus Sumerlaeota bacterium]|nr:hypothetical protein [Candidatus Sumerlaeota bacterium]